MKILSGFFGFLILALVLCFALSNRQEVGVAMWPVDSSLSLPLYLVGLAPLGFGLVLGGLLGWLASVPYRWRARRLQKELDTVKTVDAPAKKYVWERQ